ncbi:MAG: Asp-tRNA(Asn)/Glu-tRNA(Gln) amidotransferase subunit GatA [Anaerolineae bacterium]|jgi:aspartyl-tRNA(Asn)/glutamyl-tRNA(Gln) amidotransferase subunit A|nr:Asp-tRNA(Asn)/Glu-tRNA(Gln) amidotransferase subunit GatA [Anaerolineae bacterium]
MTRLIDLTITEALARLRAQDISAVELTEAHLAHIAATEPTIQAFLAQTADLALAQARAADAARAAGTDLPLGGIPLAIKDVLSTRGVATTCGSRILQGYIPPFDATCIARLSAAGMVLLGKLNCDEFAMGSSTENSGYYPTRNPWDVGRVPGGSSGGSGAAVAARMAMGSLGTDTGGSIRLPGSFCGLAALKPSYGRVSRYGLVAYGSSLDQAGPMTRSVADCARLLQVIAGPDPLDATSRNVPVPDYVAGLNAGTLKGLRIGLPREYFGAGLQPDVEAAVRAAIAWYASQGAEIHEISLPHSEYSLATYYIVATSEASANLAKYDGIRFGARVDQGDVIETYKATRGAGFGPEVKRRIMLGTYALSAGYYDAWYGKAQAVRTLIRQDFEQAFAKVDVLMSAVSPTTAFKFGEHTADPMQMYLADILTISVNLAGIPGMSIPCGFDRDGLPIGLQILAPAFKEDVLLRVAHAYEQATDWHTRRPALVQ